MAVNLWKAATVNNWRVKLADNISDSATIIGITSTASLNPSQLQAPGVLVVDRVDAGESDSPSKREYISFGSISGATLYGVTRGLANVASQSHTANSWIEDVSSVTHWTDLIDFLNVSHLSDGTHDVFSHVHQVTVTGISGASGIRGDLILVPGGNVSIVAISGVSGYSALKISGATVTGFGGITPFSFSGPLVTGTAVTPGILVEDPATIKSVSMVLLSPASGASLVIDVNKNFTSIFTNQATRPTIPGAGTYVSTASVGTTSLVSGDLLTLDIDLAAGTTLTVLLES